MDRQTDKTTKPQINTSTDNNARCSSPSEPIIITS